MTPKKKKSIRHVVKIGERYESGRYIYSETKQVSAKGAEKIYKLLKEK